MPFINVKTNVEIPAEQELRLKSGLAEAAALIGKGENWLMAGFEDNCRLYFRGEADAPIAFVEVKLYGAKDAQAYDRMTGAVTQLLHKVLNVPEDHVYVKYEEVQYWGWNGRNF